ncbi:MAG TPA: GNAT family N-acetyltransferase [Nocardioides sp.]|uniref:GNAT family N-acetyltransferase n=1 Tax=Nocardioides sp. TaxID=35761 RepID=UPI002BE91375|nr:GNAT family N-acetyltransferase [Nocardioides sp.]HTW15779.1 GNAT family N-acetyltransferase [Nocardioides sp.]
MLGPHVVGKRIVVRRVLRGETGPSGGPALTDLLGVCTAWTATSCVVLPEDGAPVEIALSDIVSGKPVPPRPSVRHRVSPVEAQTRSLAMWADLDTEPVGAWVLRHSATSRARRANSVLAFEPSGVADDYDRVVEWYAARTGRPVAAVLPDSPEEALFLGRGWGPESTDADTVFQLAGVARVRRALPQADGGVEVEVSPGRGDGLHAVARIGELASGVATFDRDWVGLRTIEVAPDRRRQGLGSRVLAALLEWAAEQGATTAYLQVLGDNTPALGLYEGLGFTEHHRYRYLAPLR